MNEEDQYESINMWLRPRSDGQSWFDVISDFISEDCEGGGGDCLADEDDFDCDNHEHTPIRPCTCGLESMSGNTGTMDQLYAADNTVGKGLQPLDLAKAIIGLNLGMRDENTLKVLQWAADELEFEERWKEVEYGEEEY